VIIESHSADAPFQHYAGLRWQRRLHRLVKPLEQLSATDAELVYRSGIGVRFEGPTSPPIDKHSANVALGIANQVLGVVVVLQSERLQESGVKPQPHMIRLLCAIRLCRYRIVGSVPSQKWWKFAVV
jgi:hypothetical protein